MKINFLGDSITEGVGASAPENNYVSLVGKKTGHEVINYGISGTRIALIFAFLAAQTSVKIWSPIRIVSSLEVPILTMAPGGFFVYGLLIALVNKITKGKAVRKKEFGCAGCPSAEICGKVSCNPPAKEAAAND